MLSFAADFRQAAQLSEDGRTSLVEALTFREQEILQEIISGKTNREIADGLFIEISTVKWYIRQIYRKLDVRNRRQAIIRAGELNLLVTNEQEMEIVQEKSAISIALPAPINPYKGLRSFATADAADFFGREALISKLGRYFTAAKTGTTAANGPNRFLAVVGPSGSGKSSLVQGGFVPRVINGDLPETQNWFVAQMTPGSRPLDELEVTLIHLAVANSDELRSQLERDEFGLKRALDIILPQDGSEVLLVIDQFEELFTMTSDPEERQQFLDLLTTTVTDPRSRLRLIILLRADFYDRPLQFPEFGALVRSHIETVLPLSVEELEQAIMQPAQRVGVTFEEGLVARIIEDVLYQPGALPLLQFMLTELFEHRNGRLLSQAAYDEMGGITGALASRAEFLYQEYDEKDQEKIRQLFLRLVTMDERQEAVPDTRRRVPRSELVSQAEDEDLVDDIIDTFAAYRLITLDHNPANRRPTVEVAHEALLREWERLRDWLNDARDDIRQAQKVSRAADEWEEHNREESYLLRGAKLAQIENWMALTDMVLTSREKVYVDESSKQRLLEEKAQREQQEREEQLERRSQKFLRGLVVTLAVAAVLSSGLALFAFSQRQAALESAADAQNVALVAGSQAAMANSDTDTAVALAWQAVSLNPDSALAQAQLSEVAYAPGTARILGGNEDIVNRIVLSPDDKMLLGGVDDGSVILWDTETGEIIWQQHVDIQRDPPWVQDVAFSPDGQFVAATYDDRIMFWHAADGQLFRQIDSLVNRQKIAFNPLGGQFATIGSEEPSHLLLWDFDSGEVIGEYQHGVEVEDIAFTADGSAILIAGKMGEITLVDAQNGEVLNEFEAYTGSRGVVLRNISLSPDGTQVIASAVEAGLLVWDIATGELLHNYIYDGVLAAEFHPDDGTVLIGDFPLLRTINPQTGAIVRTNSGHIRGILNIAITSDGSRAFTASVDETIREWDLTNGQIVRRYASSNATLGEVALSPDGEIVLVGSKDGTATLRDMATGAELHRMVVDQPIVAVAFSPDGDRALLGTGYENGEEIESGHIILWDVESGAEIRRFEGQPYVVTAVAFSPDGRLAVSAGHGAMAILWDVETGAEIHRFEDYWVDSPWAIEAYTDVAFSPDGQQIFASHDDGSIIGWDVGSGLQIQELVGHETGAWGMSFSADGQRLASGGMDSQVLLWNLETGSLQRRFIQAGSMTQPQFSPDESLLLGGNPFGGTSLLQTDSGEVIRRYVGHADSLSFTADGDYAIVGFSSGEVGLWRIDATLDNLLTWVRENRYIPELTCEQRTLYRVEPLCDEPLE